MNTETNVPIPPDASSSWMSRLIVQCKNCGHFGECCLYRDEKSGPHFAKKLCTLCGAFLGWQPRPK